jgi:hypothetical protein
MKQYLRGWINKKEFEEIWVITVKHTQFIEEVSILHSSDFLRTTIHYFLFLCIIFMTTSRLG